MALRIARRRARGTAEWSIAGGEEGTRRRGRGRDGDLPLGTGRGRRGDPPGRPYRWLALGELEDRLDHRQAAGEQGPLAVGADLPDFAGVGPDQGAAGPVGGRLDGEDVGGRGGMVGVAERAE